MVEFVAGRRFRPAALALTVAALTLASTWTGGSRFEGPFDVFLGVYAASAAAVLIVGWFINSYPTCRAGMLMSCALWVFTGLTAVIALGAATSAGIALALALLAGGSYWADARDPETP